MINNLIKISKEKERLEEEFKNSFFIKRINKILFNLNLHDQTLKMFKINKKEIKLLFSHYIGGNEYDLISLSFPISFYYKKYNVILKYILKNINDEQIIFGFNEEQKETLSSSFLYFSKERKLRIKELNRILNYVFENNSNLVIKSLTKQEIKDLSKELTKLQQIKEF